jgi:beta-lactamase regulating signal transducer with metallopeptidase domain
MNPGGPYLQAAVWALIHFLWQGALIWIATLATLRLSRAAAPQVRYIVGCAGLALCLLAPIATYAYLRPGRIHQAGQLAVIAPETAREGSVGETMPLVQRYAAGLPRRVGFLLDEHVTGVFRCWLLGSLLLALRFGGGWLYLLRLRRVVSEGSLELQERLDRLASAIGYARPIRLALSNRITTPLVLGWLRPTLLVPFGLLTQLDPVALEALLVHEVAHIRRHDYFVNVFQCMVEILLFYHPAVWWLSRQIRNERELCCDDVAVTWCSDALLYAETLTRLHAYRVETFAPALAAGGGDLMFRIKRLLLPSLTVSTIPGRLNLLALACSLALAFGVGVSLNALQAPAAPSDGWFLAGSHPTDYTLYVDPGAARGDQPSQTLACVAKQPQGFGTVMQMLVPAAYLGKRVRMSAWVRTNGVTDWAGLWMRVDGARNETLAFDNMGKRPIVGTTDWKRYEIVQDVAPAAKNLAFGLLLHGSGRAWLNEVRFEIVENSVAVTNTAGGKPSALPAAMSPRNWFLAGSNPEDYAASLDHQDKPAHLLASTAETCQGFGTLMQMFSAKAFLGKRVRLSAWVKTENLEAWAGIWMRVDGPGGEVAAFDNMKERPLQGSLDWKRYQVVLDVAPEASALGLGILVAGKGKVWMLEPELEIVDGSVATTSLK